MNGKAAWMYLEWLTQKDILDYMQYGPEGKAYDLVGGKRVLRAMADQDPDYRMINGNGNSDYWCVTETSLSSIPIEDVVRAQASNLGNLPQNFTQELLDQLAINKINAKQGNYYPEPIFSVPVKSMNEYAGTLGPLFVEYATKLVKCKPEEFDALYEKYKKEYLDAGYQKIIDERLELFKSGKSTKLNESAKKPVSEPDFDAVISKNYLINP